VESNNTAATERCVSRQVAEFLTTDHEIGMHICTGKFTVTDARTNKYISK